MTWKPSDYENVSMKGKMNTNNKMTMTGELVGKHWSAYTALDGLEHWRKDKEKKKTIQFYVFFLIPIESGAFKNVSTKKVDTQLVLPSLVDGLGLSQLWLYPNSRPLPSSHFISDNLHLPQQKMIGRVFAANAVRKSTVAEVLVAIATRND